jgi:two-component sensor histidine kinase
LKVDQLVPFSLIISELVCNSLKHAFPRERSGEVCIALRRHGNYVSLTVADDGVGFPGMPATACDGTGLQIVRALVDQLSGTIEWSNGRGTSATVSFPVEC